MLVRFITWLVTRYLNATQLLNIVSTNLMTKGAEVNTLRLLYAVHSARTGGVTDATNFNVLVLKELTNKWSPYDLHGLIYLAYLAKYLPADQLQVVLSQIIPASAISNRLKRHAAIKEILLANLPILDSRDIETLTSAAVNNNYLADSAHLLIKSNF